MLLRSAATATIAAVALACTTTPDSPLEQQCSGNGVCKYVGSGSCHKHVGACSCNAGWTGASCSQLDFLPAMASTPCGAACVYHGGANGSDTSWTSWGGQVVRNAKDKLYYMAVSEFANGCNLGTWRCNSQVALARSASPGEPRMMLMLLLLLLLRLLLRLLVLQLTISRTAGPYTKLGVAVEPWAHNAAIIAFPDGGMAIFSLGDGYRC